MKIETLAMTDFLLARIAEDEARARAWGQAETPNMVGGVNWVNRILDECESKRRIVDQLPYFRDGVVVRGHALRLLATVYADHPDYRPEWRP